MTNIFITGCAGYIASNLADSLLEDHNNYVVGFDNFSTGKYRFLENALKQDNFCYIRGDLLDDIDLLEYHMQNADIVYHLAANADVRYGLDHPYKDLEQNTIATFNVLEAMRRNHVPKIVFTSTGSVYGEGALFPTPENAPFPIQTSLYGASKLACEGLIEAYCEGYGMQSFIYRLVGVLGPRYTHGHLFDFYKMLKYDGHETLNVLGDGKQTKSYIHVKDVLSAIATGLKSEEKVNIYNVGTPETIKVIDSIRFLENYFGRSIPFQTEDKPNGWVGDNQYIWLSSYKLNQMGWNPTYTIEEAVYATLIYFSKNPWLFTGGAQ